MIQIADPLNIDMGKAIKSYEDEKNPTSTLCQRLQGVTHYRG